MNLPDAGARVIVPRPANKRPFPHIESIAIVSAIGDRLQFRLKGAFFASLEKYLPISDWGLDALLESKLREAIDPFITVKDVPADRTSLTQARLVDDNGAFAPSFPGLTATGAVDAYLVAVKIPVRAPMLNADCLGIGLGHWTPVGQTVTDVFANYALVLIDAHSLKIIAIHSATRSPVNTTAEPIMPVSDALWPSSPPALNPDQADQVKLDVVELLTETAPETLLALGLTNTMVSDTLPPPNVH